MKKPARLLALTATLVLLGACAGGPEKPAPAVATPVAQTNTESAAPGDEVERLLDRATRASPADAARLRLDAAELLSERRDPVSAREILAALDTDRLPPQMRARAALLGARIALGEGDAVRALALLGEPETGWMQTGLPRSLQVALAQTRADVLLALNRPLDAAAARVAIHPWLASEDERRENALATLAALSRAPLAQIERAAATASTEDWRGWLQLSAIIRDMRFPPGRQLERLQDWQQRYAGIPALDTASSQVLPRFREHLAQPARVALLLPLSGRNAPSGRAVLQGFAAEHFSQLGYGGTTPTIAVIDTAAAAGGFPGAYRGAIEDGATVVIGPLLKEELAALADGSLHAAVPTLALNFLDTPSAPQPNLYQFGIDVADEVAQLVIEARARGYRHAVALADTAPRARRQADDFAGRWRDAGGELLGTLYLDDLNDYREALEDTLLLEQSAARTAALTHLLGLTLQSEPRRRADLDLFVLLAEPVPARSIRALLPFLFAGDVPTWGSSLCHSGGSSPEEDLDLEGLRFTDMPWFAAGESALRGATQGVVPAGGIERLVALGADAARLQSRLALLDWAAGGGLGGASGELYLANGRIRRQSDWFVFTQGQARAELERSPLGAIAPPPQASTEGDTTWQVTPQAPRADARPKISP